MFLLGVAKNLTKDEMVKQMQDQVISMQDKQMSFLNDTIGNTNDSITIFLTALGLVSAAAIGVITYVHNQAKDRMDEAEKKMTEATQKIAHAESLTNTASETIENLNTLRNEVNTYRTETEKRVEELSLMIDEKMTKLKELEESTGGLVIAHKVKEVVMKLGRDLIHTGKELEFLQEIDWAKKGKPEPNFQNFRERFEYLKREHEISESYIVGLSLGDNMENFYKHCIKLYKDNMRLLGEIQGARFEVYEDEDSNKD